MSNVFVTSDTWFNRPLEDDPNVNVVDNNDHLIINWNEVVKKDDIVYVLGGFGIGDLYHILVRLKGKIHFLRNYFTPDERQFMNELKYCVDKSSDPKLSERIVFENDHIIILNESDVILSYFPLSDWIGKSAGTYCFHGYNGDTSLKEHNISCISNKWDNMPVSITDIQSNIKAFDKVLKQI